MENLLSAVRRFANGSEEPGGVSATPIPGMSTVCATAPSPLDHAISRPLVCLVLQGGKHIAMGSREFSFTAGQSLLITADVPTVSRITQASAAEPYFSLVLELDRNIISELAAEIDELPSTDRSPIRVLPTELEVGDAALRLMQLLDRPGAVPILQSSLLREMHYWLLAGEHGPAIRQLGWPNSNSQRVARAVAVLRAEYAKQLPVERLAAVADMSLSSFHEHFRAITSLSPLQFQKQLRLIEARRLMLSEGSTASSAAFAVGYESVPQFTREYGRMFGLPPVRDVQTAKRQVTASA
jgi:AraC-like DNA-binding protein